jgi:hypothetical protein
MKKVIEFSRQPSLERREFWRLLDGEFAIEWIDFQSDRATLFTDFGEIFSRADIALVDEEYGKIFFEYFPEISRRLLEAKKIDCIYHGAGIVPHCLMREALHELIVEKAYDLDTHAKAYVTGADSQMRVALSVLVQLGYREINIVHDEAEMIESLIQDLNKFYFGVKLYSLKNRDLTLQPNNSSILINTVKLENHADLLQDLTYLNFIFNSGLVIETNTFPLAHSLIDEAKNVGLKILTGAELSGQIDWLFLKKAFAKVPMPAKEYRSQWIAFLKDRQSTKNTAKV